MSNRAEATFAHWQSGSLGCNPSVVMGDRREKQTLIPAFDPEALAKELEESERRPTITPAFDPTSYARMVEDQQGADTPRTMTAATPLIPVAMEDSGAGDETTATMGRAMYGSYLSSDYPEALVLAERVLERDPDHALAKLVVEGCQDRLGSGSESVLSPSSVVRLVKQPFELVELVQQQSDAVLGAIDGVSDITMVAALAGVPRPEALDRLHALLALGVVEVVA